MMINFTQTIKRGIATLALLGAASVAALGSGVAHAAGPQIAVSIQQYASVLHVTGSGFGASDPVAVYAINNDTQQVETSATTTASPFKVTCGLSGPLHCILLLGGTINVNTPSVSIHCGYAFVTVYAIDLKTKARSNSVQATLGMGPC